MDATDWTLLPEHILVSAFCLLDLKDQANASLVCKSWNEAFHSPYNWRSMTFDVNSASCRWFDCVDQHGEHFYSVLIRVNQAESDVRQAACTLIEKIARLSIRRVRSFSIQFTADNPFFYSGQEFIDALCTLFSAPQSDQTISSLERVNLGKLTVALNDHVISLLANNHSNLKELNIDNKQMVCKVTPKAIQDLVKKCRKLQSLTLFKCNLSDDVLMEFTKPEHVTLHWLSIACHREEKYNRDFSTKTWSALTKTHPTMRVALKFNYMCPFNRILQIMQPGIPVSELHLATFTYIYDEIGQAEHCFSDFLEKFVLDIPLSKNSPELNNSLKSLAAECKLLKSMYVTCALEQGVIDDILELCPEMKKSKKYLLVSESDRKKEKTRN